MHDADRLSWHQEVSTKEQFGSSGHGVVLSIATPALHSM
jgi:hypothetical protein